ncbi:hypothetical protein ACIQNU_12265 [Streptomyces sp. NPDC091292]
MTAHPRHRPDTAPEVSQNTAAGQVPGATFHPMNSGEASPRPQAR